MAADEDDNSTTGSVEEHASVGIYDSSKEGTRTPTESVASGSKETSTCASPPPELPGFISETAGKISQHTLKRAFKYSLVDECVNDKLEFKRIIRKIGQHAEFKYRSIRDMFVAADTDFDGKLSLPET